MLFQWHGAHCWTRDFPGFAASPRVAGSEQHGQNERALQACSCSSLTVPLF